MMAQRAASLAECAGCLLALRCVGGGARTLRGLVIAALVISGGAASE